MKIRVQNLKRHFKKTKAVDDISFSFDSGHVFGFIGPNGAGKTTTMRIMATLDEPTEGDVFINGFSVKENPEDTRRMMGFMPDSLPAYSDVTVMEYLDFFARSYGLKSDRRTRAIEGVVEFAGLGNMREKLLHGLSKGMKQRVSLGRAMIHDPDVLVLDEPAAGLDPRARVELRELLALLAEQKKAVLISSHILTELSEICNGVIIIEKGKILETGTIEDILKKSAVRKRYAIRCTEPVQLLFETALQMPHIEDAVICGAEVHIDIKSSEDSDVAETLKAFLNSGRMITEFRCMQEDLEDIFMKVTKGELQ